MQDLKWVSCEGNVWCDLLRLNLASVGPVRGVYIIWHGGFQPHAVRVGQGNIAERLGEHRLDHKIRAYDYLGLWVTWSEVPVSSRDGVEKFLSNALNPWLGMRFQMCNRFVSTFPPFRMFGIMTLS